MFEFAPGPDGNLYVASHTYARVQELDARSGEVLRQSPMVSDPHFGRPLHPRFGPDGYLYFNATNFPQEILKYDPATLARVDLLPVANHGGDWQFGPDGNLYVANRKERTIDVYDVRTRQYVDRDPATPATDPFVRLPTGAFPDRIAFGADGDLFALAGRAIVRWDGQSGAFLGEVVPAPPTSEPSPVAFTVGPDGDLYVGVAESVGAGPTGGSSGIRETMGGPWGCFTRGGCCRGRGRWCSCRSRGAWALSCSGLGLA